jgi:2-succinyl-5-enolpyruvyl-6-hydroxy-3-cyclohexene-1-carboxylate synthase
VTGDLHSAWARLLVGALVDAGVSDFVVSPGSRSTPLALAVASSGARAKVVVDERAAAFFALGQARVVGRPSALVCTSGTAGAHYLPAVIEASEQGVPLVIVTADRPWELVGCGASQTIDQAKLFGDFVRWFVDVGAPDPSPSAIHGVARVAAQAVARSLGPSAGPVHVNARFRKPLEPVDDAPGEWGPIAAAARAHVTRATGSPRAPDLEHVRAVMARLARAERGVVVAGPARLGSRAERDAALALAAALGFPLVAESTSQLRFGDANGATRAGPLDLTLRAIEALGPDVVLQLGAAPVTAAYAAVAERAAARVVVSPHGWADPWSAAGDHLACDVGAFAAAALAALSERRGASTAWLDRVARLDAVARGLVRAHLEAAPFADGHVARGLRDACPAGALLVVGNSSPVRDLDLWCGEGGAPLDVVHQRGAAGIDGLVAGAAGAHDAARRPTALLLGDVSLAHDLGGLALAPRDGAPLVIVVVDNGGGRIFEALPVVDRVDAATFDRFFVTAPTIDASTAAAAFALPCARAETPRQLARALDDAFARAGTTVVHAVVPRGGAARELRELRAAFAASVIQGDQP